MNVITQSRTGDIAGSQYWEKNWKDNNFRRAIDPAKHTLNNYVNLRFHDLFRAVFAGATTRGKKLIELGCGSSEWLPYFAREFGFEVAGLDYSQNGCDLASKILSAEGVSGQIVLGDLFAPPVRLKRAFDVAVSFGVVEHFTDTASCLKAMAEYLTAGGRLLTVIPNMKGVPGTLQKWGDGEVYAKHVPIDRETLARAHREAGLEVEFCDYYLSCNLGVLNIESWKTRPSIYSVAVRVRSALSKLVWLAEPRLSMLKPNRWTSPYVICHAVKV
jgi:2-polyprenyl-3-methyl-5-hydroxy-6-metoxy-1,4-benzoquinol methylase